MNSEPSEIGVVICCTHLCNTIASTLDILLNITNFVLRIVIVDRTGICTTLPTSEEVQVLSVPSSTSLPEMRSIGTKSFKDHHVIWLGDYVLPTQEWLAEALFSLTQGFGLVTGPVLNTHKNDRFHSAWYIAEYHDFCPPLKTGSPFGVASCNVGIHRTVVGRLNSRQLDDRWNFLLFGDFYKTGVTIFRSEKMAVTLQRRVNCIEGLVQRYFFSRSISGQLRRKGQVLNSALALSRLLLPLKLGWKLGKEASAKGHLPLWQLAPSLFLIICIWSIGEFVGYLSGAGQSTTKVC